MVRGRRRWTGLVLVAVGGAVVAVLLSMLLGWGTVAQSAPVGAFIGAAVNELWTFLKRRLSPVPLSDVQEATARLMRQVEDRERQLAEEALSGRNRLIPLRFRSSTGSLVPAGGLGDAWMASPSGRMLVVGGRGAGKTFAVGQMIRQIIEESGPDGPARIPVRITAASQIPHGDFDRWLTRALVLHYDVNKALAATLVENDVILPVIDGVDELGGGAGAANQHTLMRMINSRWQATRRSPVVVTCRQMGDVGGVDAAARSALEVFEVCPVPAVDAADYLVEECEEPARAAFVELALDISAAGEPNPLSTPLELALAVRRCSTAQDVDDLRSALRRGEHIEFLMPAFLKTRGFGSRRERSIGGLRRSVRERKAVRVLHRLAGHLEQNHELAVEIDGQVLSTRDVVPHLMWPSAGVAKVLRVDFLLALLVSVPGLVLVGSLLARWQLLVSLPLGVLVLAGYLIALAGTTRKAWIAPARLPLPPPRLTLRQVLPLVVMGLVAGCIVTPLLGWLAGSLAMVGIAAAAGLTLTPVQVLVEFPIARVSPWEHLQEDRRVSRATAWVLTPAIMAAAYGLGWGAAGVVGAAAYGIAVGETVASAPWRRYVSFRLAAGWSLPFSLRRFLDDMHRAGVLRINGGAYQFPHAEFQRWLAAQSPADIERHIPVSSS